MDLKQLIEHDREVSRRIGELMLERECTRAAIVAHCPAKPGAPFAPEGRPAFWIDKVGVRDDGDNGLEWTLVGHRLKKDGTRHATAHAWWWITIPESE